MIQNNNNNKEKRLLNLVAEINSTLTGDYFSRVSVKRLIVTNIYISCKLGLQRNLIWFDTDGAHEY